MNFGLKVMDYDIAVRPDFAIHKTIPADCVAFLYTSKSLLVYNVQPLCFVREGAKPLQLKSVWIGL